MNNRTSPTSLSFHTRARLFSSVGSVLVLFLVTGLVTYLNTRTLSRNAQAVADTHEVLLAVTDVLSLIKDCETGQRGFLITGEDPYLEPYNNATLRLKERVNDLERLTRPYPAQQMRIPALKSAIASKLAELSESITKRRTEGFDSAKAIVETDRGRVAMEIIRDEIGAIHSEVRQNRILRLGEMANAYRIAVLSCIVTGILGVLLATGIGYLVRQSVLDRQRQDWLQTGQIGLAEAITGDLRINQLGDSALRFLAVYLDAHAGAFFAKDGGHFRRVATYGVPATSDTPEYFEVGDGLLGQAVKDGRTFVINDVPSGYLSIGSALGSSDPRQLLIAPASVDDDVNAVVELGFIHPLEDVSLELFTRVSELIGAAVQSSNYRAHLQNLLEETQRQTEELQSQSEELQAQGEELRVSNEELEEQSRVLKESQVRLEQQQAELEQTNYQLEQQTVLLESQRNEASQARNEVQKQARELERTSQYKSDFLANMSHELRTPLNSSLILAKLLADNRDGNLTAEQVQYAETIQASGNDLLALINDILDLSKIEAGHMDVHPNVVHVTHLVDNLNRVFNPVAESKGLAFRTQIMPGCPDTFVTDQQRVEQVLKNILSNALKFTERGEVTISVSASDAKRIAFAVTDTGIGIAPDQQRMVFEAFRQADSTTARKSGGTGLGLSISRQLMRILGGEIDLASEAGRGSTFTIKLPLVYEPVAHKSATAEVRVTELPTVDDTASERKVQRDVPAAVDAVAPASRVWRRIADDRERLTGSKRIILVVEDDETFAKILLDLAHELGFQCLIATSAEEGIAVAIQFRPSAVVLDVGLPDHSGLSVLDRLKQDARTRHIPVHVVSAGDHSQTALSLGAVGHMIKPVKRDDLAEVLQQLESIVAQRVRRVLIVEDDAVQRDSVCKLLGSREVEAVGVGSAAECLEQLKGTTYDCMVLDLSLPDATGYSLLETLSNEDAYAFPPVIVYTGRELSPDEEQQLRRYSKSIIIKGAKSPERLLDEVTLFLHQVVSDLPPEQQRMLERSRSRDAAIEGRRILVVEDDVRNVFALTSILEPRGAIVQIARNGREALDALERSNGSTDHIIDLVLMDVMMPEMDGITATREIRQRAEWKKLPIIMLTAKAMKDDQEHCLAAGANDYVAKPLNVEKLLSLIRVWMPR